jgi:bifunctional non-homologous end joining protein LigD
MTLEHFLGSAQKTEYKAHTARASAPATGSSGEPIDSLLVGYYEGRELMYGASVRASLPSDFRRALFPHFEELQITRCPFVNLPDRGEGRWGEGLTLAKMAACRWLDTFLVARVEFLEWTPEDRLRHPRFVGLRSDKDAREVVREYAVGQIKPEL